MFTPAKSKKYYLKFYSIKFFYNNTNSDKNENETKKNIIIIIPFFKLQIKFYFRLTNE